MLDVRTILVLIIVTNVLLAVSLWVAVGQRFRDGLGKWTISLFLQAFAMSMFANRAALPAAFAEIVPNAILMSCLTMQVAALLEFQRRAMSAWWHVVPACVVAVFWAMLLDRQLPRTIFGGIVFGAVFLVIAHFAYRLPGSTERPARRLIVAGMVLAAVTHFSRAITSITVPEAIVGVQGQGVYQTLNLLSAFAVTLVTSFGFLLLHKERAEDDAQHLAATDPLTGAFNRRTFLELGAKEHSRSRRSGEPLSLIMLDLDHFKHINDFHSHLAGDEVLRRFADVVQICLRKEDLLVRYGGEEFCVLLPDVTEADAERLAERIRYAVEHNAFRFASKLLPVTVSVGVACMIAEKEETLAELVGRADEALYAAKHNGRNRVVSYPNNTALAMLMKARTQGAHAG